MANLFENSLQVSVTKEVIMPPVKGMAKDRIMDMLNMKWALHNENYNSVGTFAKLKFEHLGGTFVNPDDPFDRLDKVQDSALSFVREQNEILDGIRPFPPAYHVSEGENPPFQSRYQIEAKAERGPTYWDFRLYGINDVGGYAKEVQYTKKVWKAEVKALEEELKNSHTGLTFKAYPRAVHEKDREALLALDAMWNGSSYHYPARTSPMCEYEWGLRNFCGILTFPSVGNCYGADSDTENMIRSNEEAIEARVPRVIGGTGWLLVQLTRENMQAIRDLFSALESYPLLDEDRYSELEMQDHDNNEEFCTNISEVTYYMTSDQYYNLASVSRTIDDKAKNHEGAQTKWFPGSLQRGSGLYTLGNCDDWICVKDIPEHDPEEPCPHCMVQTLFDIATDNCERELKDVFGWDLIQCGTCEHIWRTETKEVE